MILRNSLGRANFAMTIQRSRLVSAIALIPARMLIVFIEPSPAIETRP
jgi:hypothetical protein